jgi:hypothetical protein
MEKQLKLELEALVAVGNECGVPPGHSDEISFCHMSSSSCNSAIDFSECARCMIALDLNANQLPRRFLELYALLESARDLRERGESEHDCGQLVHKKLKEIDETFAASPDGDSPFAVLGHEHRFAMAVLRCAETIWTNFVVAIDAIDGQMRAELAHALVAALSDMCDRRVEFAEHAGSDSFDSIVLSCAYAGLHLDDPSVDEQGDAGAWEADVDVSECGDVSVLSEELLDSAVLAYGGAIKQQLFSLMADDLAAATAAASGDVLQRVRAISCLRIGAEGLASSLSPADCTELLQLALLPSAMHADARVRYAMVTALGQLSVDLAEHLSESAQALGAVVLKLLGSDPSARVRYRMLDAVINMTQAEAETTLLAGIEAPMLEAALALLADANVESEQLRSAVVAVAAISSTLADSVPLPLRQRALDAAVGTLEKVRQRIADDDSSSPSAALVRARARSVEGITLCAKRMPIGSMVPAIADLALFEFYAFVESLDAPSSCDADEVEGLGVSLARAVEALTEAIANGHEQQGDSSDDDEDNQEEASGNAVDAFAMEAALPLGSDCAGMLIEGALKLCSVCPGVTLNDAPLGQADGDAEPAAANEDSGEQLENNQDDDDDRVALRVGHQAVSYSSSDASLRLTGSKMLYIACDVSSAWPEVIAPHADSMLRQTIVQLDYIMSTEVVISGIESATGILGCALQVVGEERVHAFVNAALASMPRSMALCGPEDRVLEHIEGFMRAAADVGVRHAPVDIAVPLLRATLDEFKELFLFIQASGISSPPSPCCSEDEEGSGCCGESDLDFDKLGGNGCCGGNGNDEHDGNGCCGENGNDEHDGNGCCGKSDNDEHEHDGCCGENSKDEHDGNGCWRGGSALDRFADPVNDALLVVGRLVMMCPQPEVFDVVRCVVLPMMTELYATGHVGLMTTFLCLVSDVFEAFPDGALEQALGEQQAMAADLVGVQLANLDSEAPMLRQAAAFGFGMALANARFAVDDASVSAALKSMLEQVEKETARDHDSECFATDNTLLTIARIVALASDALDNAAIADTLGRLVEQLPLTHDTEEAPRVLNMLCDFVGSATLRPLISDKHIAQIVDVLNDGFGVNSQELADKIELTIESLEQ